MLKNDRKLKLENDYNSLNSNTDKPKIQVEQNKRIYNIFYSHLEKYALIFGFFISAFYVILFNMGLGYYKYAGLVFVFINTSFFVILGHWMKNLIHYTNIDYTTKLYNRKYLSIQLDSWLNDIKKKRPVTMLVIDIDHFKEINDGKGHLIGDKVIKDVAALLKNKFGKQNIVARWGGDEFVVALEKVGEEKAYLYAQEIIEGMKNLHCRELKTTVSIGLVTTYSKISIDELFHKGDKALYEAKKERNKIVRYSTIS